MNDDPLTTFLGGPTNGAGAFAKANEFFTQLEDQVKESASWETPIPLGGTAVVPNLPTDCFPPWLSAWIEAESVATQTPPDLPALIALAVCGAALAKRFRVIIRPGWSQPVNLYCVVALPPGDRKSAVFHDATAPVYAFEQEEQVRLGAIIAAAQCDYRLLEKRIDRIEKDASKALGAAREQLQNEARDLSRQLAATALPESPQFVCDDCTPEALGKLLAEQGGRILQASPEGTAFEIAGGRYGDSPNFDVYLKGHAGDHLVVNRIKRVKETVPFPAMSVALAVQPDVIHGLAQHASMRGRGFLARWCYAMPLSRVGRREIAAPPMPQEVEQEYKDNMRAMWATTYAVDETGQSVPHLLTFTGEADQVMRAFEQALEPRLGVGGDLFHLAGWAEKLAGCAARIAGILHVAEAIGQREEPAPWIETPTVQAAIRLGIDYLLPHADAAFGLMGADKRLGDAKRVVRWVAGQSLNYLNKLKGGAVSRNPEDSGIRGGSMISLNSLNGFKLSQSKIHAGVFGGTRDHEDVEKVLELLVKYGYLRPIEPEKASTRKGRKPSQSFHVNPIAVRDYTHGTPSDNS